MSIPQFAVIGRVNRGKSSIVAVLVEDDNILIGPEPGTTKVCRGYRVSVNNIDLFEVIDTPGFQCPEEMLEILEDLKNSGLTYQEALAHFYKKYKNGSEFQDECQIISAILGGARVIYVVDASRPYRPNMDSELEILRWSGAPRIAVLNYTSSNDYTKEWETELLRSFNLIRRFDAFHSRFHDRIQLLDAFKLIDPAASQAIDLAVSALKNQHEERRSQVVSELIQFLSDAATLTIKLPVLGLKDQNQEPLDRQKALEIYQKALIEKEKKLRQQVELIFNYKRIKRVEGEIAFDNFDSELLTKQGWRIWGLTQAQLIKIGAGGGAGGLILDIAGGGLGLFTVGGALIGGMVAYISSNRAILQALRLKQIATNEVEVGPISSPQFYAVVLHRALAHFHYLQVRTHAVRSELHIDHEAAIDVIKSCVPNATLKQFLLSMKNISKGKKLTESKKIIKEHLAQILSKLEQSISPNEK